MIATPLHIDEAIDGYLRVPSGRCRHILGLDRLIQKGIQCGVEFYWSAEIPGGSDGYAHCWQRRVFLSPTIVGSPPFWIRRTLLHELGHVLTGRESEELADVYGAQFFRELIEPDPSI